MNLSGVPPPLAQWAPVTPRDPKRKKRDRVKIMDEESAVRRGRGFSSPGRYGPRLCSCGSSSCSSSSVRTARCHDAERARFVRSTDAPLDLSPWAPWPQRACFSPPCSPTPPSPPTPSRRTSSSGMEARCRTRRLERGACSSRSRWDWPRRPHFRVRMAPPPPPPPTTPCQVDMDKSCGVHIWLQLATQLVTHLATHLGGCSVSVSFWLFVQSCAEQVLISSCDQWAELLLFDLKLLLLELMSDPVHRRNVIFLFKWTKYDPLQLPEHLDLSKVLFSLGVWPHTSIVLLSAQVQEIKLVFVSVKSHQVLFHYNKHPNIPFQTQHWMEYGRLKVPPPKQKKRLHIKMRE